MYDLYKNKCLAIVSISKEEDKNSWQSTLKQENMIWPQLIVPDEKRQSIKSRFEVGSIPYILFLDNKGKLIYRSIGIEKESFEKYKKIIDNYLKNK